MLTSDNVNLCLFRHDKNIIFFVTFVDLHHLDANPDLDPDPVRPIDLCGSGILHVTYMRFRICKSGKLDTDPHLHNGAQCVPYPHRIGYS